MTARPTTIRNRTLAWLTTAAALAYLCRNAVGVAESTIREELSLNFEQSGWFMGAFFYTYAIFQVPSGWFSQRFGTRISLTLFALGWSAGTAGIGVAPEFWLLIGAQLVMGVAQAGIFPASVGSIGHWMPLAQRSLACGILAAGMQIGAIAAAAVTGELMTPFGWRTVFLIFAIPGIVWAAWFYARFRNRPEEAAGVNSSELELIHSGREANPESDGDGAGSWFAMGRTPGIWLLCGQQICRAAGYMFFASWFPSFLQETRGVSVKDSGYLQGLVLAGTLAGSLSGGGVSDWIWRRSGSLRLSRSGVGATALGICSFLILGAWFVQSVALAVALLTAGSFFAALAGPAAISATIDVGGTRVPQVYGLMNMCGNFAAAACPVLVGIFFDWTAQRHLVLLLFAGVYLAGAICWAFVKPGTARKGRY